MKTQLNFILAFFVLFLFSANDLFAQDKIHFKKKGKVVEAKIIEVGTTEIKYKLWEENENGLTYVVEKTTISFIEFESGRKEYFGEALLDQEDNFVGQKRRAIKISWAGFLAGYSTVAYEQVSIQFPYLAKLCQSCAFMIELLTSGLWIPVHQDVIQTL